MTVLVTGSTGHLGANLVRRLLDEGRTVRALVRGAPVGLDGLDVEIVKGDVLDEVSIRDAMDGVEVLFHLAAMISITGDPEGRVRRTNVDGVRNVMHAALDAGVSRVVHCSSVHAYDLNVLDAPITERSPRAHPKRQGAYDNSKKDGEKQVRAAIEKGLDAVIVNPTGVIGPHDYRPSRMGRVFLDLYNRKMPSLVANAGFDFVDVRDVIDGAILAEQNGRTGENYLLSGKWHSVRDIARTAERHTGIKAPRLSTPIALARIGVPFAKIYGKIRKTEPLFTHESLDALKANRNISHEKAASELGYNPRPLSETVPDIYDCFKRRGVLQ